jgi:hypothetical protein
MYSKLIYKDPYITHKTKPASTVFYMPNEPDGHYLVASWNLNHHGRFSVDSSGKGNFGRFTSNPEVVEGIDDGFGTSLYVRFDGETTHMYAEDVPKLRLSVAPYFSITGRIYPEDLSETDEVEGKLRTIISKSDTSDTTGQHMGQIDSGHVGWGYRLGVTPDGKMRFTLLVAGVKYTVETLANVILASDPPFPYDFTVTVNQVNKRTIPAQEVLNPADNPGASEEAEPEYQPPLIAPRMEISVDNEFYAIYTTDHLHFVDDGPFKRLRVGAAWSYPLSDPVKTKWYRWLGGIQQLRIYQTVLTFPQIEHLHQNRLTVTEMPLGSAALAGYMGVFDIKSGGYDPLGYQEEGYWLFTGGLPPDISLPGFDPNGYDPTGFDTLNLTEQGTLQDGGFDPRGYSREGFHCIPFSQS